MPRITTDDRLDITETIGRHGHVFDAGELDRLGEILTEDVVYDVSDLGGGVIHGIDATVRVALELGDGNPLAHHVTNVEVLAVDGDRARARCKAIGVHADGTTSTATYLDTLVRTTAGWRIGHRVIEARRTPLGGAYRASNGAA